MEFLYSSINAAVILGSTRTLNGCLIATAVWIISFILFKAASDTAMEIFLLLAGLSGYVLVDLTMTTTPETWQQAIGFGILMYIWTLNQTFILAATRENNSPHIIGGTLMVIAVYLLGSEIQSLPLSANLILAVIIGVTFGFFCHKTRNGSNVMTVVFTPIIILAAIIINGLMAVSDGPYLTITPATIACIVTAFLSLVEGYQPATPVSAPHNDNVGNDDEEEEE